MESINQKKEYLERYRCTKAKIKSLEDQRESLRELTMSAKAISYDDMPKGNKDHDLSDYIIQLDDIYCKLFNARQELATIKADIKTSITNLPDNERRVIYFRYISTYSWRHIEAITGIKVRDLYRLHGLALQKIAVK